MKALILIQIIIFFLVGCVAEKGKIEVNFKNKLTGVKPSISSVQIINHQLVINGVGFNNVNKVQVNGNSLNESFSIESKTSSKIITNSNQAFSFDISKVFNLILSDANASTTFQIDFSLCHATLNNAAFDCSLQVHDNDVLAYNQADNAWIPQPLNGLSYQGTWNANTTEPTAVANGQYWIVSVANSPFAIGDWIVWNQTASAFNHIRYAVASGVSTVFGRPGVVVATEGDYNLDKLLDVEISSPTSGQVLKYNGTKWVAANEAGGTSAPSSVTTTELADGSVTDAKIASVASSKITGTISSSQITDLTIVNADISATAAIDYSKLNIPAQSIPYAKLNIADGDIPAAKISGLPSGTAVLTNVITDGDTTHAPDGNVIFDTFATKLNTTGGTISTMLNVPPPVLGTEATTKTYVDDADDLRLLLTGGTVSGVLNLDSDLKIKGGTNYVTIRGHATSTAYSLILPIDDGTPNQVLTTNGSGALTWETPAAGATGTITALTGDVTASGTGSVAAAVANVGGVTAANVAAGANLANAATNANTVSTIVKRDSSGNFTAGTITANLVGTATNVTGTVAVANGGTGATTLGVNQLLFGNGTSAIGSLGTTTTPSVLLSTISTGAPTWTTSTATNFLKGSVTGVLFGPITTSDLPAGSLTGSGTANYIPYYSDATTMANSPIAVSGTNVSVGSTTPGTNTKLNVEGQLRSKSFSLTTGAVDWVNGNSGSTTFDCGTNITFANLRDGGSYLLAVTGAGTTKCTFSTTTTGDDAGTVIYKFIPANAVRTASTDTIYSFQRIANVVYVSWITGF